MAEQRPALAVRDLDLFRSLHCDPAEQRQAHRGGRSGAGRLLRSALTRFRIALPHCERCPCGNVRLWADAASSGPIEQGWPFVPVASDQYTTTPRMLSPACIRSKALLMSVSGMVWVIIGSISIFPSM